MAVLKLILPSYLPSAEIRSVPSLTDLSSLRHFVPTVGGGGGGGVGIDF